MPPHRQTFRIDDHPLLIQVTDDESRTLVEADTQVAYHSASGAVAETKHVYLQNSLVAARLSDRVATSVLEIGLGIGLGMLLTLDAALVSRSPLQYTALENQWLEASILGQLEMDKQLHDPTLATRFLDWRQSLGQVVPEGVYRWQAGPQQGVQVHHIDALIWESDAAVPLYDAIYFDPFAPDANPELWQADFLAKMHRLLKADGRLVTYCVSRKVRDDFTAAGFNVSRVPGPSGGKREVLVATKV